MSSLGEPSLEPCIGALLLETNARGSAAAARQKESYERKSLNVKILENDTTKTRKSLMSRGVRCSACI